MVTVFKHRGDAIDFVPDANLPAGSVVVIGDLVGVTKLDIAAGVAGSLHVSGVFAFEKATGASSGIAAGTKVFWDATAGVVTTDENSGTNKYVGKVTREAGDDDATVEVRVSQ